MLIKVLGPGCKKCHEAEKIVKETVVETGSDAVVEYITDITEIIKHGIFSTPAVMVDGKVKAVGKVPTKADVRTWIGK
ncbi:MAG: thioredoxin family protein [Syntrophobacteraceae bacterium]